MCCRLYIPRPIAQLILSVIKTLSVCKVGCVCVYVPRWYLPSGEPSDSWVPSISSRHTGFLFTGAQKSLQSLVLELHDNFRGCYLLSVDGPSGLFRVLYDIFSNSPWNPRCWQDLSMSHYRILGKIWPYLINLSLESGKTRKVQVSLIQSYSVCHMIFPQRFWSRTPHSLSLTSFCFVIQPSFFNCSISSSGN